MENSPICRILLLYMGGVGGTVVFRDFRFESNFPLIFLLSSRAASYNAFSVPPSFLLAGKTNAPALIAPPTYILYKR